MLAGSDTVVGTLGEYRLLERIGEGGFAVVFRARLVDSGRDVAIKLLRTELLTEGTRDRFRKEVAALRRLAHVNIAPLLDVGDKDGCPFLVMPWLAGTDLARLLREKGPLPAERTLEMARAIGDALAHAHGRGTVHRDITPSNIIWSGDQWWLIDFGIAFEEELSQDERLTSTGLIVGTSRYMSPEQAAGSPRVDARSDQYSLACVMYEVLAGVPPFVAASAQATRIMRLHTDAQDLRLHRPGLSAGMCAAIHRAMAREPADRHPDMGAFVLALGSDARVSPAAAAVPSWRRYAVGAALLLAAAWGVFSSRGDPLARATPPSALDPRNVAVTFFEDLTPDSSLRWLARGLTRDLIHELSSLDTLRVVSATRVQQLRGPNLTPDSIARLLDVGTLIEGTVRIMRSQQVEVLIQLTDASRDFRVRSWSFKHPLSEAISMMDELHFAISSHLREQLGAAAGSFDRRSTVRDLASWRMVQQAEELFEDGARLGRYGSSVAAWSKLSEADSLLAQAARRSPRWADPWILRARIARSAFLALTLTEPVSGQQPGSAGMVAVGLNKLTEGLGHAEQALRLVPTSGEAQTFKAYFHFMRWQIQGQATPSEDLAAAERIVQVVVREHPEQALAWVLLSRVHRFRGAAVAADSAARRAYEADPFLAEARRVIADLVERHLESGRIEAARRLCEDSRRRYADDREVPDCRLEILGWTAGQSDSVRAAWEELRDIEASAIPAASTSWTMRRMYVAVIAARAGLRDSAYAIVRRAYAERGANRADSVRAAMAEAWIHLVAGDSARAAQKVDSLLRASPAQRQRVLAHPWFRAMLGAGENRARPENARR